MAPTTSITAVGVFTDPDKADAAIADLRDAGFRESQIGVATRDVRDVSAVSADTTDEAEEVGEGALAGAITGAGVGGLVGLGVLAGVIPVIGPALFAGTLGVLATNAAGGAAVAGIIGALMGWGISEEDAKYYEGEIAAGRTIVTVTANDRVGEARSILRRNGATSKDPAFAAAVTR